MLSQLTTPSCRFRAQTRSSARSQCRHKLSVVCRCTPSRAGGQQHEQSPGQALASRAAAAVLSGLLLAGGAAPVGAAGLESFPLPGLPIALGSVSDAQQQKLDAAEESFASSSTLKRLLEQSAQNKAKNAKDIRNKYCYRQAELGIGDCGGLSLIPGMTKNGKQKTPDWLAGLLGAQQEEEAPMSDADRKTLEQLLGGNYAD